MYFTDSEIEKCTVQKGDLLVCEGGDFGRSAIWPYETKICIQNHIHKLRAYFPIQKNIIISYFICIKKLIE
jgi:type I restriction enzyme S subunit